MKHRLYTHFTKPKREEHEALDKKYNFSVNSDAEALERKNLVDRNLLANALDSLAMHPRWSYNKPASLSSSDIDARYYKESKNYYKGPREKGHTIWLGYKANLTEVLIDAFIAGYAIDEPEIQKLLSEVALAKIMLESNGNGAGGRVDDRRR